MQNIDKIKKL